MLTFVRGPNREIDERARLVLRAARNSKGGARMSRFAAAALTADRIDYWIRRYVIRYWHETHPSQRELNDARR